MYFVELYFVEYISVKIINTCICVKYMSSDLIEKAPQCENYGCIMINLTVLDKSSVDINCTIMMFFDDCKSNISLWTCIYLEFIETWFNIKQQLQWYMYFMMYLP